MGRREYSQKAALVTGGARGIGKAVAEFLAGRGYRVAVCDVRPADGLGNGIVFIRCDVSREPSVRACIRRVVQRFGRLDALVNNAGIADPHTGPIDKLSPKEWNRRIGVLAVSHALAMSLGPQVRVNCVSPGWIDTGKSKIRARDHAQHAAGRVGRPRDIAELAAFLLSERSGFTSGANFVVDGGMTRKMIYV